MTTSAQQLLDSFDSLADADKQQVAVEILRRFDGELQGDLPESALVEATDELFCMLDREEAANAPR